MIELDFIITQLKRVYPEYNFEWGKSVETNRYYVWVEDLFVEGCRVCKELSFSCGTKEQVEEMGYSMNNIILFLMKAVRTIERVRHINKERQ
jgi:hypothetical protein